MHSIFRQMCGTSEAASFEAAREASVRSARSEYIRKRVEEMLSDPAQMCRVVSQANCEHPTHTGAAVIAVMRERVGAVADLSDLLCKAAEDIAHAEWAYSPVAVAA